MRVGEGIVIYLDETDDVERGDDWRDLALACEDDDDSTVGIWIGDARARRDRFLEGDDP